MKNSNFIKNSCYIFFAVLFLFFITGCFAKTYTVNDVHFKKNMTIDLNSKSSPFDLIHDVDGVKPDKKSIKRNSFTFRNLSMKCKTLSTKKEGRFNVTFTTNDPDVKSFTKTIEIADISKPKIQLKKKKINVFSDEVDSLNYYNYFKYEDNSKYDELTCIIDSDQVQKTAGKYQVVIRVFDKSKNMAKKELSIIVKDRPVEKKEEVQEGNEEKNNSNNNQNYSNNSASNSTNRNSSNTNTDTQKSQQVAPSTRPNAVNPTQYNKYFAGNSIEIYDSACSYAESIVNSGKANGYSVMPDGNGFNVTFN